MKRRGTIKYEFAPDVEQRMRNIVSILSTEFGYLHLDAISCIRSTNSGSRGTIARCHALNKVMQLGLGRRKSFYVLEFLHERFDKLSGDEQDKVIIHELMHIPKSFGGGFRHHDYVCDKNIEQFHRKYRQNNVLKTEEITIEDNANNNESKKTENSSIWKFYRR